MLGVVQGLTEFLPISSSGHLVITGAVLGIAVPGVLVEVVVHVATLLAVIVVYWRRLLALTTGVFGGRAPEWRSVGLLAVGTIPAGVAGVLFSGFFEGMFESLRVVGVSLGVTGVILWSTRWIRRDMTRGEPTWLGAFVIGAAQAVAIVPGISRSGTTVVTAMWLGVGPVQAAEYSFLLAIPAIAGAAVLQVPELSHGVATIGAGPLAVSFGAALISGILAIRGLIAILRIGVLHRFAPYVWSVSLVTLLWALVG